MNIDLTNYEAFLLMYVDNELSAAEKQAVETFVAQHPAIAQELELLKETVLPQQDADCNIGFQFKNRLYKSEHQINTNNIEEKLLLHIDNELNPTEETLLQQYLNNNPESKAVLQNLLTTKLDAETILHPNKSELYREETKIIPLWALGYKKWLAAACLIGLSFTLWMTTFAPKSSISLQQTTIASNGYQPTHHQSQHVVASGLEGNVDTKKNTNSSITSNVVFAKTISTQANANQQPTAAKPLKNRTIDSSTLPVSNTINNNIQLAVNTDKTNLQNTITLNDGHVANNHSNQNNTIVNQTNNTKTEHSFASNQNNQNHSQDNQVQAVAYRELDTETENKSLYIGALEINKDKLRGVTRRLASFFGKKSKKDEEAVKESFVSN